jgi:hypothetical protein
MILSEHFGRRLGPIAPVERLVLFLVRQRLSRRNEVDP